MTSEIVTPSASALVFAEIQMSSAIRTDRWMVPRLMLVAPNHEAVRRFGRVVPVVLNAFVPMCRLVASGAEHWQAVTL